MGSTFARKDVKGKMKKNGDYVLSAADIRMLNDSVRNLWFKTYGNIETADIKNEAITLKKIASPVQIDISTAKVDGAYSRTQVDIVAGQVSSKVEQGVYNSYVTQTALALASKVANDIYESYKVQTADAIAQKVSGTDYNGNEIASLLNQSATTIDILASKLNLTGYATFSSLSNPGQSTIDGGNITTDTISTSRLLAYNSNKLQLSNGCSMDFTDDELGYSVARLRRSTTDYIGVTRNGTVVYDGGDQVCGFNASGIYIYHSDNTTEYIASRH